MCNLRSVWVALKRAGVLEETIIVVSTPPPRYGTSHSCMPAYQWTQTTGATCVRQDATNHEAMSSVLTGSHHMLETPFDGIPLGINMVHAYAHL